MGIKYELLSKHCYKERKNMAVAKNLWVTINLHKKSCFSIITWNKKHSSKQAVLVPYGLGKKFFVAATSEDF